MADVEWPLLVAFHFSVGFAQKGDKREEISFQEVSGLEVSIETEEVRCGGDNSTVYHLPKKTKYSDLVLKRAVISKDDSFYKWCKKNLNVASLSFDIELKSLFVNLCDNEGNAVKTWMVAGAYPFKWSLGNLDAMKNEIAIETISLKYQYFKCIK